MGVESKKLLSLVRGPRGLADAGHGLSRHPFVACKNCCWVYQVTHVICMGDWLEADGIPHARISETRPKNGRIQVYNVHC